MIRQDFILRTPKIKIKETDKPDEYQETLRYI